MNTRENLKSNGLPKIGMPATNALANVGITTLQQVSKLSEKELLSIHGVGPKAVRILKEALRELGLTFKTTKI